VFEIIGEQPYGGGLQISNNGKQNGSETQHDK